MINLINLKNAVETLVREAFDIPKMRTSETSKVRSYVIEHCHGHGLDVGCGGDKIKKENCIGVDLKNPYTQVGNDKINIRCDIGVQDIPVPDDFFDYVYSSHLIEDFHDTATILRKLMKPIKPGGKLILVFPDQRAYVQHCLLRGEPTNEHHVHERMGLRFMLDAVRTADLQVRLLMVLDRFVDYNVVMVMQKLYIKF